MSIGICLRDESMKTVMAALKCPQQPHFVKQAISHIINRQVKQLLIPMLQGAYEEVLSRLEKNLRRRTKAWWATCFGSILILTICAEVVQTGIDLSLASDTEHQSALDSRNESFMYGSRLEEVILNVTNTFHGFYKTNTNGISKGKNKSFNPLRDDISYDDAASLGPDTVRLINNVKSIVAEHRKSHDLQTDSCL